MKVGVIVGRFQVPELTEGHRHLISEAISMFDKVYIFIGCTKEDKPDIKNPLPYDARFMMLLTDPVLDINKVSIHKMVDLGNWSLWVKLLDRKIKGMLELDDIPEGSEVYICGSRDSVADKYKEYNGEFNVCHISEVPGISGTKSRSGIEEKDLVWNLETRKAVICMMNKVYEDR